MRFQQKEVDCIDGNIRCLDIFKNLLEIAMTTQKPNMYWSRMISRKESSPKEQNLNASLSSCLKIFAAHNLSRSNSF